MTRTSRDELDSQGYVVNGYNYDRQCWVRDYHVVPCGHPDSMKPNCCYAGSHAGEDIRLPQFIK